LTVSTEDEPPACLLHPPGGRADGIRDRFGRPAQDDPWNHAQPSTEPANFPSRPCHAI